MVKLNFTARNLRESARKWIEWLTRAFYTSIVEIREEFQISRWDETWLPILSRYVRASITIFDGTDRSPVWMKYTQLGELWGEGIMQAGMCCKQ